MLKISGLNVSYAGLHALADVSLEVGEGEFVTIVGPNGAGKTTLLKAIGGGVLPAGGRIEYPGENLARPPAHAPPRPRHAPPPGGPTGVPSPRRPPDPAKGAGPASGPPRRAPG